MDTEPCPVCGEDVDIPEGGDWFDEVMDQLIYGLCSAEESRILAFLMETDPDGGLVEVYMRGGWE